MSVYIDDFLLASNMIGTLESLKQLLAKEYNMKDMGEVKTIIWWQIIRHSAIGTIKIDLSALIKELVIEESLIVCNFPIIPIKAELLIEMLDLNDYEKTDLNEYKRLIGKFIYFAWGTRPDLAFAIGQLFKQNADPRKNISRL